MQHLTIPHGWYTWALPNGQWGSLIVQNGQAQHVATDRGPVAFYQNSPNYAPLFLRPSPDGRKMAGKCWGAIGVVEYDFDTAQWRLIPQDACGNFSVIYDLAGTLHISDCAAGVNGWRYCAANGTPAGRLVSGDATYGPTATAPLLNEWTDLSAFGDTLVLGQGNDMGGVIGWDGSTRRVLDTGECFAINTVREGGLTATGYYKNVLGQSEGHVVLATVAELKGLPVVVAPPPPPIDTFGPVSEPVPDGTAYRMADFVFGTTDFNRTGDHDMAQVTRPEGRYLVKFGQGAGYELWGQTPNGDIHHLEDASGFDTDITQVFTNTLWCMATMRVGRQFMYRSPEHEAVFYFRSTKQVFRRDGYLREMWLWRGWEQFDCGPDLGVRRVIYMVYDPTAGVHTPVDVTDPSQMRAIEIFIFAEGLGWIGWESHHSGRVYEHGFDAPQFNPYTRLAKSYFYRNGGRPVTPRPTGLAIAPTYGAVPVNLPNDVQATIRQFAALNPLPQGPEDDEAWQSSALRYLPNGWTARLAQQLAFSHGPNWGQKRRGPGAETSAGRIARKEAVGFRDWDILIAAASGRPTLTTSVESEGLITDQEFLPVTPVNHIAQAGPTPGRAVLKRRFIGTTAFDLACRVAAGDFSYYNQVIKARRLSPVVQAYIKTIAAPRIARTMDEGLVQLERLFGMLERDNLQCMVIAHVGTGNDGATRAQALDYGRRLNALCMRYPNAIEVIVGGLELTQSFEADYMLDPQFHKELEACFDLRFPYAPGAGHGGEPVYMPCGSVGVHHEDRGLDPDTTGRQMRDAQIAGKRQVIGKEPKRVQADGDTNPGGQSTRDINVVKGYLKAMEDYNLGGSVVHVAAGRACDVNALDALQNQALDLYAAKVQAGGGGTPVGDPILDAPLTPVYPTGYIFFVTKMDEIMARVAAEYQSRTGRIPARSDIAHNLWRAFNEGERWHTLRGAMEDLR